MKFNCYEILLIEGKDQKVNELDKLNEIDIKDDGTILNEMIINGNHYAIANPGSEFSIKVNIFRDKNNKFPYPHIRIGLYCDGNDCNYWKRLDLSNENELPDHVSARFWGFKRDTEDIRAFVFATPEMVVNDQIDEIKTKIGEIKVIIHEAEIRGGLFDNKTSISNEIPNVRSIDGSTKFWKQASLTTIAGRRIENNKEKFPELIKWANKTTYPQCTLQLNYHTKDMLDLMQRIQNNNVDSNLNKRKRESKYIDLTLDDDDDNDDNDNNDNDNDKNKNKNDNSTEDDEYIEVIKVDKEIDVLDITNETEPIWSTVKRVIGHF